MESAQTWGGGASDNCCHGEALLRRLSGPSTVCYYFYKGSSVCWIMFGQLLMHSCGRGCVGISLLYFQTVDLSAWRERREAMERKQAGGSDRSYRFLEIVHERIQNSLRWREGEREQRGRRRLRGGGGCPMRLSKHIRENRLRTSKLHRQAECQQLVISGSWLRQ